MTASLVEQQMETYSYQQQLLLLSCRQIVVEESTSTSTSSTYKTFTFKKINIDVNKEMGGEETPNYKNIAELIKPDKHLYIKCKQQLARVGLICDSCFVNINHLVAEFDSMSEKKKEQKEEITTTATITTASKDNS
jgi:hypothetical protein